MKCKDSNFWIGLGIGSVAGALAYHFSRTEKAKKLEDAICRAIHKANGEAKCQNSPQITRINTE